MLEGVRKADVYKFQLPITTEETLRLFIWLTFGVRVADTQVCPNHSTPWRAFCDAYFARTPSTVWFASRGLGGKTFLMALLCTVEMITLECDTGLLGGSGEQSARGLEAMGKLWGKPNAPVHRLDGEVARETRYRTSKGEVVRTHAHMASQRSVRGAHPPRLRIDEVDEIDLKLLDAALGQPMMQGRVRPQIAYSSTRQHPDGTFTEVMKRAEKAGHPIHEWCWRESMAGWLSHEQVEFTRSTVPKDMWDTEYENQEPNPQGRAILTASVEKMFDKALGEYSGEPDQPELRLIQPEYELDFSHGADWAKEMHLTVQLSIETSEKRIRLAAYRAMTRLDWPYMISQLAQRVRDYSGSWRHDATGVGNVVADFLPDSDDCGEILMGHNRYQLFTDYIRAIENGEFHFPRIRRMYTEHKYVARDDLYGSGHPPDNVVAGALAYRAYKSGTGDISTRPIELG